MPKKQQFTLFPESWFEEHNEWLGHAHVGQVYTLENLQKRFRREGFRGVYATYADGPISRFAWEIGNLAKKVAQRFTYCSCPSAKFWLSLTCSWVS